MTPEQFDVLVRLKRTKRPACLRCHKPAVHPKDYKARGFDAPRFCSLRCAADYAVEQSMDWRWCAKHEAWFDLTEDGSCNACNMELELALAHSGWQGEAE